MTMLIWQTCGTTASLSNLFPMTNQACRIIWLFRGGSTTGLIPGLRPINERRRYPEALLCNDISDWLSARLESALDHWIMWLTGIAWRRCTTDMNRSAYVIIMIADDLAPNGARPSASIMLT